MPAIHVHNLQLYCDNRGLPSVPYINKGLRKGDWRKAQPGEHVDGQFPTEFIGRSRMECLKQARVKGWKLHQDGRTFCPRCSINTVRRSKSPT